VTSNPEGARSYEIRIRGRLDARWNTWFEGFEVTNDRDGTTVVRGVVADQTALHGVLQRVRDAALPLISLTQVDDKRSTS
jgi:hypothetical protein